LRLCILFSLMNMPAAESACAASRLDRKSLITQTRDCSKLDRSKNCVQSWI